MRRVFVVPLAGLLTLAVAGPALAGANVSNTSGQGETIYGEWFADGSYGYAYLGEQNGVGGFGEIYQESGEWILCEPTGEESGEPEPKDTTPGEEFYGFRGTRTFGWISELRIEFTRKLASGTAVGTAELTTELVDECAGTWDLVEGEIGEVRVAITGIGSAVSYRGSGSYQIPSEFNAHQNVRGTEREAIGTIVAGTTVDAAFDVAYASQVSWSEHSNG